MPLLIENCRKSFKENHVLRDFSCELKEGEFTMLLGPSGCGKTTLLSMLGGFQKADSGTIALDGKKINCPSPERGYVFQNYALFPWMNVRKNIMYSLKMQKVPRHEREERLQELLELAHLKGHEKKYPTQLSGGMQQRVAVLRALASRPRVLLLDEPLAAVDFQMRENMQRELEDIVKKAKTTVVMVTHDVAESVYLGDRVLVMQSAGGSLLADIKIDMPRPRDRQSPEFREHVASITELLRKSFNYKEEKK